MGWVSSLPSCRACLPAFLCGLLRLRSLRVGKRGGEQDLSRFDTIENSIQGRSTFQGSTWQARTQPGRQQANQPNRTIERRLPSAPRCGAPCVNKCAATAAPVERARDDAIAIARRYRRPVGAACSFFHLDTPALTSHPFDSIGRSIRSTRHPPRPWLWLQPISQRQAKKPINPKKQ